MLDVLFSPFYFKNLILKNRILFPSVLLNYSEDGLLNSRITEFYRERSCGRPGAVIFGPVSAAPARPDFMTPSIHGDADVASFGRVREIIQKEGPSPWMSITLPDFTEEKVHGLIGDAAIKSVSAGFEALEIDFTRAFPADVIDTNDPSLLPEKYAIIIQEAGRECGDVPLIVKVPFLNRYLPDEIFNALNLFKDAGAQAFSLSGACGLSSHSLVRSGFSPGAMARYSGEIRRRSGLPVFLEDSVTDPFQAAEIIEQGLADMIIMREALIAEPRYPAYLEGGHYTKIRPCVMCLKGCSEERAADKPLCCSVNPLAGNERELEISPKKQGKKVMVIGAGVSGMEAALRAAMAGCYVELYEKSIDIGGRLRESAGRPHYERYERLIDFYADFLKELNVDVCVRVRADAELIRIRRPDYVIISSGCAYKRPDIKGADSDEVISHRDYYNNSGPLGEKIAVVGVALFGEGTALALSSCGLMDASTHIAAEKNGFFPEGYSGEEIIKSPLSIDFYLTGGELTPYYASALEERGVRIIRNCPGLRIIGKEIIAEPCIADAGGTYHTVIVTAEPEDPHEYDEILKGVQVHYVKTGSLLGKYDTGESLLSGYRAVLKMK